MPLQCRRRNPASLLDASSYFEPEGRGFESLRRAKKLFSDSRLTLLVGFRSAPAASQCVRLVCGLPGPHATRSELPPVRTANATVVDLDGWSLRCGAAPRTDLSAKAQRSLELAIEYDRLTD